MFRGRTNSLLKKLLSRGSREASRKDIGGIGFRQHGKDSFYLTFNFKDRLRNMGKKKEDMGEMG